MDENEVESLALQLSEQVAYTNELLLQLAEHEKQQLNMHREAQSKQIALRQAMSVCDSVRADQAELRRKLSISQELASRASNDAKKYKVQYDVKAKEVEGLQKFAEEARNEIDHMRHLCDQKDRVMQEMDNANAKLSEQLDQFSHEESLRVEKSRGDFEELSRELAELKALHRPIKTELNVAKARNEDLSRELETKTAELKRCEEDLSRAKRRAAQLEENERNMMLASQQYKSDLHNEQSKAERTQQEVAVAQNVANQKQAELDQARKEISELSQSNRALQDEIRSLNSELETVGNDLMGQARKHGLLKDQLEGKIHELQSELSKLASESRERERQASENARNRATEFSRQRKMGEQQYAQLQDEYRQMHDMLQRTQNELEKQMEQSQAEKEELESRIGIAQDRLRNAEADLSRRDADAKRESGVLLGEISYLQNQMSARSGAQVEALGMLSSTIIQLASEAKELLESYNAASAEIDNLKADIENQKRLGATKVQDWHADTKRALADLAEANNQSRIALDSVKENLLSAEVQRDEERAKNLMLEEEHSRLVDEVGYLKEHVKELETASRERLENARLEYESLTSEQSDLAQRVQALTQQLEEVNSQNRSLSQERQRAAQSLADNQTRNGHKIARLEENIASLEQKLRKTVTERDAFEADRELLRRSLLDSNNNIKTLQSQISSLDAQNKELSERGEKTASTQNNQVTKLRETLRQYQGQLQHTKGILKVVQDQKKHLQDDNVQLRAELDDVFRRSLNQQEQEHDPRPVLDNIELDPVRSGKNVEYFAAPQPPLQNGISTASVGRAPSPELKKEDPVVSSSRINGTSTSSSPEKVELERHHHYHYGAEEEEETKNNTILLPPPEQSLNLPPPDDEPNSSSSSSRNVADNVRKASNPLELDLDSLRREVEQLKMETEANQ